MAYKHFTSCYSYPAGGKPYNEKDRIAFVVTQVLIALVIGGTFALAGLIAGPFGAIIGGALGTVVGLTNLISNAADQWLNHRLICLNKGNPECAVGVASYNPTRSELGVFDNDQYFDVVLMPHPTVSIDASLFEDDAIKKSSGTALVPKNRYGPDGKVVPDFAQHVADHPANDILTDHFQGETFLSTRADIATDLGYAPPNSHERNALHCEAEGDFWVRMNVLAPALATLLAVAIVVTAVGAAAGSAIGSAIGCALGSFFGPIGCAIGGFLGGLLGGAAGAAAAGALTYFGAIQPILQAIFDAGPGDIQDANVGDTGLGPLKMGDRVVVLGERVYDGYHFGWNEFHPLMAVVKIDQLRVGPEYYLEWQPDFAGTPPLPPPGETILLTVDDMKAGLDSEHFRSRCVALKETWCRMLQDAFSEPTRQTQQGLEERWTVHPMVDGCRPAEPDPPAGPH